MSSPLTVLRFSWVHFSEAGRRQWLQQASTSVWDSPSLVMKEINSLTHSCMHSLASFAIFAFSGRAVFMIRATGAKLRMLASDATVLGALLAPFRGGDEDDWGEEDDMAALQGP